MADGFGFSLSDEFESFAYTKDVNLVNRWNPTMKHTCGSSILVAFRSFSEMLICFFTPDGEASVFQDVTRSYHVTISVLFTVSK